MILMLLFALLLALAADPAAPVPVSGLDGGAAPAESPAEPPAESPTVAPAALVGIPPRRVPERWTIPDEVLDAVRAVAAQPIGVRMEAASRPLLGLPYFNGAAGDGAAGEGSVEDPDPPSRYDTFDCLTFVEETLSLAMAPDPLYAPLIRDSLRYQGAPVYQNRRHFMEAQWVPDAIASGLLTDITPYVGRARTLRKTVDLQMWKNWGKRTLFHLPDERLPVGTWSLNYLSLDEAIASVPRLPAGAILLVLRYARDGVPIVVRHIGMVVPTANGMKFRHATRMGSQKVRDDRVEWYVGHLSAETYSKSPILGISVLYPREIGPRLAASHPPALPATPLPFAEGSPPPPTPPAPPVDVSAPTISSAP